MKTRLLCIVASLRTQSTTHVAVQHVMQAAQRLGAEVELVDLHAQPLPMFEPDQRASAARAEISRKALWANAFLLGTPDYHGSMSGAMKNFLDYLWREFAGKLCGYVCASHEKGLTAMDQMRTAVRQCYGWSLPYGVSITTEDIDVAAETVSNPRVAQRLEMLAHDLTTYAPLLWRRFETDLASDQTDAGFASHYRPKKS